jgi:hypothetical protein
MITSQINSVLLARYHIVNERRRAHLVQQREQLNSRVASLSSRLRSAQQQLQQLQQQCDLLQYQPNEAQQAAGKAAEAAHSLRDAQRAVQQLPLEDAPGAPLPRMGPPPQFAPPLEVGLLLLHPRMVAPNGQQLLPAPQDKVNMLLGNSPRVQQLVERQDVLAPMVCLAAAECPDVARCLAGYVGRDLTTLVAATHAGAQALRQ